MTPLRFCFALHVHQPVGNFDHVFRQHADDVYTPFLDFLDARALWPIGLHVSGPLLEWLGENDSALHDRIGRLADEGRIELLSAGWYEPILAALGRQDRATQLGWMREELERRFGVTPRGLWLTERVWEPDLPCDLAEAGIEYALIDDHLALRARVPADRLQGPLRAEAGGRTVDLLAIDERLRYLIPFRPADEVDADLRRRHAAGEALALLGDDGEKFGGWPRTREWLYEGGWLAAFGDRMDALRSEGVVRMVTPAQARDELPATGPVYLPTGSYPEMEGWAPGGHWKGFLARYDEANRMHRRMIALSTLCRGRGDPSTSRRAIGRGQCNDAYWHGVFGGLYMKHLREGVRRQLLAAERGLRVGEALSWSDGDHDGTGGAKWWAHGARVSAWIDARYGGTLTDLLWLDRGVDVLDVLTRRREAYHEEALRRGVGAYPDGARAADSEDDADEAHAHPHGHREAAPSIHDVEGRAVLDRLPAVDPEPRALVRDRVLGAGTHFDAYRDGAFSPVWVSGAGACDGPRATRDGGVNGLAWRFATGEGAVVEKVVRLDEGGTLTLEWSWRPEDFPADGWFAPELSLGAAVSVRGPAGAPAGGAGFATSVPDDAGAILRLALDPLPEVWRYPIITVSKCPDGFEEIEQGVSLTPRWPVALGRARATLSP